MDFSNSFNPKDAPCDSSSINVIKDIIAGHNSNPCSSTHHPHM